MNERQGKPVIERFQEWAATNDSKAVANRAEFLRVREDVETMLGHNLSIRNIWGFLTSEGRITYGLSSFTRDVRRAFSKPGTAARSPVPRSPAPPSDPSPAPAPSAESGPPVQPASSPTAPADPPASEAPEPRPKPKRFHHPESPDMKDYL